MTTIALNSFVETFSGFVKSIESAQLTGFSALTEGVNKVREIASSSLAESEKWAAIANQYQHQYDTYTEAAAKFASKASQAGDAKAAEVWNSFSEKFAAVASERGALGNEAWVKQVAASESSALSNTVGALGSGSSLSMLGEAFAKYAGPVADVAQMGVGLYEGLIKGDWEYLGKSSSEVFYANAFALGAGALLPVFFAAGLPVWAGVVAVGAAAYVGVKVGEFVWENGFSKIGDFVNLLFQSSRAFVQRVDPLTLDLDGDGLETVGINTTNPILFDHDGDGVKSATGWVKPDDAFLVFDRNGNGLIDSGRELFGDATPLYTGGTAADGFAALAQEDSNHDGLVNSADANWSKLKLWRDLNQDGISQANELLTLDSQNITALKVAKTANSQTLANGNQIADLGGFIKSDGSEGALGEVVGMGDINLADNPFYSEFTDSIPLADAARALADLQGAGRVRDLREAASLDGAIAGQINGFAGQTRAQMLQSIDALVATWADTSAMPMSVEEAADKGYLLKYLAPGMQAGDILAVFNLDGAGGSGEPSAEERERRTALQQQVQRLNHLIGVLERFNGVPFVDVGEHSVTTGTGQTLSETTTPANPNTGETSRYLFVPLNAGQVSLLEQSYAQLRQSVYDGLVVETRLKPYLDRIGITIDEAGVRAEFSGMAAANDGLWREVA